MNVMYKLSCNQTPHKADFFTSKEVAREALKRKLNDVRNKFGVRLLEYNDDKLFFIFGWEEAAVVWEVVAVTIFDSLEEYERQ